MVSIFSFKSLTSFKGILSSIIILSLLIKDVVKSKVDLLLSELKEPK